MRSVPTPTSGLLPELSDNEKRFASIAVIGLVGYLFWKSKKKR
jgi:hypothetical protein